MKILPPIRSVVFDFDGTLVDSLPDVAASLNRLLDDSGYTPLDESVVRQLVGHGAFYMVENAFAALGETLPEREICDQVEQFIEIYRQNPVNRTTVYPGVKETLAQLSSQGVKIGVCSNKPYEMLVAVTEALDLANWFVGMTGGDTVEFPKPDGRHVLDTLKRMEAAGEASLMVGDSKNDILAAIDAGLPTVAVTYGYAHNPSDLEIADFCIDDLTEVLTLISTSNQSDFVHAPPV